MKFLDEAKIHLASGKGGQGCIAFHREKFVEFGGPDGGNGGKGGDVIFRAVPNLNTLIDFRYQQHFKAQHGQGGAGRNRSGAKGEDLIIPVPIGTQIFDDARENLLADFTEEGQEIIMLRGGDGGMGNAHYKSSTNQAPKYATPGFPGQEMSVWLRLKLIADVGLVGLPNAGKSTFLARTTAAKPKIADYPFTTLKPQLGVVNQDNMEFVIADIPGLIEGASEGAGLGTKFLGHIERCSVLLHLIDGTMDDVAGAYAMIRHELAHYDIDLTDRDEVLALNKIDALSTEVVSEKVNALAQASGKNVFAISGVSGDGIADVLRALASHIVRDRDTETPAPSNNNWSPAGE